MKPLRITSTIVVIVCLLLNIFCNFNGITKVVIYIVGFICCGIVLYDDYKKGRLDSFIRKFRHNKSGSTEH